MCATIITAGSKAPPSLVSNWFFACATFLLACSDDKVHLFCNLLLNACSQDKVLANHMPDKRRAYPLLVHSIPCEQTVLCLCNSFCNLVNVLKMKVLPITCKIKQEVIPDWSPPSLVSNCFFACATFCNLLLVCYKHKVLATHILHETKDYA